MGDIPKVYKVVVETDGELVSRTAGGNGWTRFPSLTYKEGEITYAPADSFGVFVDETMEDAQNTVKDTSGDKVGVRVIHEAIPLGEKMEIRKRGFEDMTRYPAILLGKEVWREEPVRPEPKFKVGDRVRMICSHYRISSDEQGIVEDGSDSSSVKLQFSSRKGTACFLTASQIELDDRPEPKFKVGDEVIGVSSYATSMRRRKIDRVFWAKDEGYNNPTSDWLYRIGSTNYGEEMLELASPEPVWKDVTKECVVVLKHFSLEPNAEGGFWIELSHNGEWLMEAGLEKTRVSPSICYRIDDFGNEFGDPQHLFKVFKKEVS